MAAHDTEQLQRDLLRIESNIQRLVAAYDDFLGNATVQDPRSLQEQTESLIARWRGRPMARTTHRFKLQSLAQRYASFREKWERERRLKEKRERVV